MFGALPDLRGLPERAGPVADTHSQSRVGAHRPRAPGRDHPRLREHRQGDRGVRAKDRVRACALRSLRRRRAGGSAAHRRRRILGRRARRGCGCSSARPTARPVTTARCSPTIIFTIPASRSRRTVAANDSGRAVGVRAVDGKRVQLHRQAQRCKAGRLRRAALRRDAKASELVRAFKTPSLRNAVDAPALHARRAVRLDQTKSWHTTTARRPRRPARPS